MAANNTTAAMALLEIQARSSLSKQSLGNLLLFTLGALGALTNGLILLTIFKTKSLHNKSHYAILYHSLTGAFLAFMFSAVGLRRYLLFVLGQPGIMTAFGCSSLQLLVEIFMEANNYAILALGIDRLVAVSTPIFYRKIQPVNHMIIFNGVSYAPMLVNALINYSTLDYSKYVAVCVFSTAFSAFYQRFMEIVNNVFAVLTILVYLFCLFKIGRRYWGNKWQNAAQRNEWSRDIQLQAFKSVVVIAVTHILSLGASTAMTNVIAAGILPPATLEAILPYFALTFFPENISHLLVYFCTNTSFRNGFLVMTRCRSADAVVPI